MRIEELQGNQLQLLGNILGIQICVGIMLRKLGDIHREYKSQLALFEGKLDHDLKKSKATYEKAKAATELVSHEILTVNEIAMMNKMQLEALAKDFNNHSCYRTQQTMDITHSFSTSCSISPYNDTDADDDTALDKEITKTVREIELKRSTSSRHRKQMKRLSITVPQKIL